MVTVVVMKIGHMDLASLAVARLRVLLERVEK